VKRLSVVFLGIAVSLIAPARLKAEPFPFDYFNNFSLYGTVENFSCPLRGICGAVEMMNSFVYLDNRYTIYSGNKLVPGNDPNRDALWFAGTADGGGGWDGPNGHRDGYYTRTAGVTSGQDLILLQTKQDWVNDWAPGTTVFHYRIGESDPNFYPNIDFLAAQMEDHEDVELVIESADGKHAHAIGLTDIKCDANGNCSIRFQDPNDPTVEQKVNLFTFPGTNKLGFAYNGTNWFMRSALAESPVDHSKTPEPTSILLLGSAVSLVITRKTRHAR
jgi:hypothetical protein